MWIAAQSNIRLLRGVPLDPTYDHTIYFISEQEQAAHFINYTKYNLTTYVYQRVNKGSIRVAMLADYLYDCNYMMFKNDAYGNKWFYAFITSVEYINDNVSEIRYEMDELQTWHFDYTIDECFVEREHSLTDNIGDNTLPENVETGPFLRSNLSNLWAGVSWSDLPTIVIFTSSEADGTPINGILLNGLYTSVGIKQFTDYTQANSFITAMTTANRQDAILAIYIVPFWMVNPPNLITNMTAEYKTSYNKPPLNNGIDGYFPKNNKLYTAQFYSCLLTNNQGDSQEYAFELFRGEKAEFIYRGTVASGIPVCIAYPDNYGGGEAINDRVVLNNFAIGPYTIDGFRAWWAENQGTFISGTGTTILGDIIKTVANPAAGVASLLSDVATTIGGVYDHSRLPPKANQVGVNSSMAPFEKMCISYQIQYIRAEYARIIDDFFTKFGYKTNRVKVPNRNARPYFTYCKTLGCTITGSIPGDSARKICDIYNMGITWWKPNAVIGDYSVNNSPI